MRAISHVLIICLVLTLMSFIPDDWQMPFSGKHLAKHITIQPSCTVTGLKASSVTENRAKLNYSVKGSNVTGFGLCWGNSGSPTRESGTTLKSYEDEARDIPVEVSFSESVTRLKSGTKYHVRAYVTDAAGNIYYSDEVSFTTKEKEDFSSQLSGPKTELYSNGKVARTYTMKDGVLNGSVKSYSDSGNLVMDQYFVDGIPNGLCVTYFKSGQVESESYFVDGLPQGMRKEYYKNGNIKLESICTGEMDNLSCFVKGYFENGGLRSESKSAGGELLFATTFDDQGRITSEQKPGTILSYWYDRDGDKHTSLNGGKCQCAKCN